MTVTQNGGEESVTGTFHIPSRIPERIHLTPLNNHLTLSLLVNNYLFWSLHPVSFRPNGSHISNQLKSHVFSILASISLKESVLFSSSMVSSNSDYSNDSWLLNHTIPHAKRTSDQTSWYWLKQLSTLLQSLFHPSHVLLPTSVVQRKCTAERNYSVYTLSCQTIWLQLHTQSNSTFALYIKFWMKKIQNMPVWLCKMVLPQHFYTWCWGGQKDSSKLKPKA